MYFRRLFQINGCNIITNDKRWETYLNKFKTIHYIYKIYNYFNSENNIYNFPNDITYNILLSNKLFISRLNIQFKNKYIDTNVMAFKTYHMNQIIIFDIIVSLDFILSEVKIFNVDIYLRLQQLVLHGILHCYGYNDCNYESDRIMEHKENNILNKI